VPQILFIDLPPLESLYNTTPIDWLDMGVAAARRDRPDPGARTGGGVRIGLHGAGRA
jgi:hypothetical protein